MRNLIHAGLIVILAGANMAVAQGADWVEKSNEHAQVVLDVFAKFAPEGAGSFGVDGLDDQITDLGPGIHERGIEESEKALAESHQTFLTVLNGIDATFMLQI